MARGRRATAGCAETNARPAKEPRIRANEPEIRRAGALFCASCWVRFAKILFFERVFPGRGGRGAGRRTAIDSRIWRWGSLRSTASVCMGDGRRSVRSAWSRVCFVSGRGIGGNVNGVRRVKLWLPVALWHEQIGDRESNGFEGDESIWRADSAERPSADRQLVRGTGQLIPKPSSFVSQPSKHGHSDRI